MAPYHDTMRPEHNLRDVSATLVRCGIDSEGMATFMAMASTLYARPHEAVLREYACNARDALRVAGSTDPVRVTLPSTDNPTLVICDTGIGMSADFMLTTLPSYSASTKRDRDDQTGQFGIGLRSGYAISDQFAVTSVHHGKRTSMIFAIDPDGFPAYRVLGADIPTADPDGTTVTVPVRDVAAIRAAAQHTFRYWRVGTVEIDGQQPAHSSDFGTRISDHIVITNGHHTTVICDGVPYSIDAADDRRFRDAIGLHSGNIRLDASPGQITPSHTRESLTSTPRNRAFFDTMAAEFTEKFQPWIDSHANPLDALIAMPVRADTFVWRGHQVNIHANLSHPMVIPHGPYSTRLRESTALTQIDHPDKVHVVIASDPVGFRRTAGRVMRAQRWSAVVLVGEPSGCDQWLTWGPDHERTHTEDDIRALDTYRPATSASGPSQPVTQWSVATSGGRVTMTLDEIRALDRVRIATHDQFRFVRNVLNPVVLVPTRRISKALCEATGCEQVMTDSQIFGDDLAVWRQRTACNDMLRVAAYLAGEVRSGQVGEHHHPALRAAASAYPDRERLPAKYATVKYLRYDTPVDVIDQVLRGIDRGKPATATRKESPSC